jgi:hypothetical protein
VFGYEAWQVDPEQGWTVLSPITGQATIWAGTRSEAQQWAHVLRVAEEAGEQKIVPIRHLDDRVDLLQ